MAVIITKSNWYKYVSYHIQTALQQV